MKKQMWHLLWVTYGKDKTSIGWWPPELQMNKPWVLEEHLSKPVSFMHLWKPLTPKEIEGCVRLWVNRVWEEITMHVPTNLPHGPDLLNESLYFMSPRAVACIFHLQSHLLSRPCQTVLCPSFFPTSFRGGGETHGVKLGSGLQKADCKKTPPHSVLENDRKPVSFPF